MPKVILQTMTDMFTPEERSRIMSLIKSRDTKPELIVRRVTHRLGFRFRLHRTDLPGRPDIVLPKFAAIINVHGCFWHRHSCKGGQREPVSNVAYWQAKRARNVARDRRNLRLLRKQGWRVLVVWECQLGDPEKLANRIERFIRLP